MKYLITRRSAVKNFDTIEADYLLKLIPHEWLHLPPEEQTFAVKIYRLLALGSPIPRADLANQLGAPLTWVHKILDKWPAVYFNENDEIIGFWGLGLKKLMPYDLIVDGVTTHTWCAWDAIFIPQLLGKEALVISRCPVTNERIEIFISGEGEIIHSNEGIMVSFIDPDGAQMINDVISSFCHYIFFFSSEEAGIQWIMEHQGTYLLTLKDTQILSARKNHIQLGV